MLEKVSEVKAVTVSTILKSRSVLSAFNFLPQIPIVQDNNNLPSLRAHVRI